MPATWFPQTLGWGNYLRAWTIFPFFDFTKNSIAYVFASLIGEVLSCSLAAYGFARIPCRGRNFWFAIALATMMLPNQVTLIPQFILFKNLGWLDTLLPLIVPTYFGNAFYIFLLRQFFLTLPTELDDAAKIDGANPLNVYWRIIMPLAKPTLATVAIFSFLYRWNDFLGPLLYLSIPEQMTLAVCLQLFRGPWRTDSFLLMA